MAYNTSVDVETNSKTTVVEEDTSKTFPTIMLKEGNESKPSPGSVAVGLVEVGEEAGDLVGRARSGGLGRAGSVGRSRGPGGRRPDRLAALKDEPASR